MIPRALPKLITDALQGGWRVEIEPFLPLRDLCATFTYTPRPGGHGTTVVLAWAEGRIEESTINDQPTPYTQCTRLIRSPRRSMTMTTDPFTTAARAEAEPLIEDIIRWDDTTATDGPCDGTWDSFAEYLVGRGWTRDRLAAQEPTDAEVRAVMKVARTHYSTPLGVGPSFARAVLDAARAVGRDAR